ARGKFFDSGEEGCEFPHAFVVQNFAPRGHTGVADSGSDSVEDVPLGIIKRLKDDLRRGRVKRILKRAGLLVESAVTEGAVHGVNLHAVDQVGISSRNWIIDARSVTLHRGVQRAGSDAGFERRRGSVGSGGRNPSHAIPNPSTTRTSSVRITPRIMLRISDLEERGCAPLIPRG